MRREEIADPRDMVTHLVAVKQDRGFPGFVQVAQQLMATGVRSVLCLLMALFSPPGVQLHGVNVERLRSTRHTGKAVRSFDKNLCEG